MKERTVIGYGASTMQGVGDSQGGFFMRVTRELCKSHSTWQCVNLGIGGNTTTDMLNRIGEVDAYRPFTAVVILGCNDVFRVNDKQPERRNQPAAYLANLEKLFPKLAGPDALFISSFPSDGTRSGVFDSAMDQYLPPAVDLAKKFGFAIWDLYREMRGNPILPSLWAKDGNHFNDTGHAMIAERVLKHLTSGDAPAG